MKKAEKTEFASAQRLASLIAKEYAQDFFRLLGLYKTISASEAASRLGLHVKTAQDFLEGLDQAGIVDKMAAEEGKRPYFRYSLIVKRISLSVDLEILYQPEQELFPFQERIRERKDSGALFKEGKGHRISSLHVFEGEGRSRTEIRINLTECQGIFLFYLPFPTEEPLSVSRIIATAGVAGDCLPEVMDLIGILAKHNVIEIESPDQASASTIPPSRLRRGEPRHNRG